MLVRNHGSWHQGTRQGYRITPRGYLAAGGCKPRLAPFTQPRKENIMQWHTTESHHAVTPRPSNNPGLTRRGFFTYLPYFTNLVNILHIILLYTTTPHHRCV